MMPDFGNTADLSVSAMRNLLRRLIVGQNNLAAWLNGTDFDVFGGAAQFETDCKLSVQEGWYYAHNTCADASLRQTFAQDVNWTDLLTNS